MAGRELDRQVTVSLSPEALAKGEVQLGEPNIQPGRKTGLSFCMYPSYEPATKWLTLGFIADVIGEYLMTYYVYILQSEFTGRYYCGQTKNLEQRLRHHNDPDYRPDATTRRFNGPWTLVWSEKYSSRSSALRKERQIKGRGIKRFLDYSSVG